MREPTASFEFFPPKNPKMHETLMNSAGRLATLRPSFVSVTYGAGGSTRGKTLETLQEIHAATQLPVAAHLTCVGAARPEIDAIAGEYWEAGIRHIVALRGDAPGSEGYRPRPDGYAYATDLVAGLKRIADFEISVAAYPEVHPEAADAQCDIDSLKAKIDAGASRAITQFFFDARTFLDFRDRAAAAGITAPIVPGILPIVDFQRAVSFATACGATVPERYHSLFAGLESDPETRNLVAASVAAELCQQLRAEGVDEFHFYTLNRAELTLAVCRTLGIPAPSRLAA